MPLYAHMGDKTTKIGAISSKRPTETFDFVVAAKIDRLSINDYEDLFAEVKQ